LQDSASRTAEPCELLLSNRSFHFNSDGHTLPVSHGSDTGSQKSHIHTEISPNEQPAWPGLNTAFTDCFDSAFEDHYLHTQSASSLLSPDLNAGPFHPSFENCSFSFPTTQYPPSSTIGLTPTDTFSEFLTSFPQNANLALALDQHPTLPVGGFHLQEDEPVVGLIDAPPFNFWSSPASIQSTTIRCSWPTCEKEFKNRSDYKYVDSPPRHDPQPN
jgi:hypothetical protein